MAFLSFVGRVLFVSVFVLSAWQEFNNFGVDGGSAAKALTPKFNVLSKQFTTHTGFQVPTFEAMSMAMQALAGSSVVSESSVVYLSVGGVLLFVLSFAMGVGPVPGLLLSEIFPGRIRAKAMAICMVVHWVDRCSTV